MRPVEGRQARRTFQPNKTVIKQQQSWSTRDHPGEYHRMD